MRSHPAGEHAESLRVPIRMRRPSAAREALGLSPLVKAGWAYASCVKRVPLVSAGTKPFVFFAGRPVAERTSDARVGWLVALVLIWFAIQNVRFCSVTHTLMFSSDEKPILSIPTTIAAGSEETLFALSAIRGAA